MSAAALIALPTTASAQTNGTWTSTSGGTWGDSANWSGGVIAGGTGGVADFTLDITGVQTVTLNAPVTTGTILFGDLTGANGGWALTSSTLTLATVSGAPTISVTGLGNATVFGNQAATISSVIAGSNGLNKSGTSALVLSGVNTYSGNTTVNGGFLVLNNASALGNSSSVTVSSGAIAIGNGITIGAGKSITNSSNGNNYGGITAISGGTGTWAGSVTGGGRIGYENNSVLVLSGSIGGATNFVISGLDAAPSKTSINTQYGVLVTGTNNAYTGQTQIGRGVLKIGADNALPTTTTLDIRTSGINAAEAAGFDLNGFNQTVAVLSNSGITGTSAATANASAFLTNSGPTVKTFTANQATSGTFNGIITGNLAFTKSGAGNLTLTPFLITASAGVGTTGTNTFSGDTLVSGGTLTLGNANALFGSTFDTSGAGTLSLGTLSAATFGGLKNSGTVTLTNSGSAFALSVGGNNASSSFAGRLTGLGSLTKVGSGTFTLTGATSDYSGATTLAGGALALGSAGALPASGTITFSGGALQYSASNTTDYTARIASSGSAVAIDTNGQAVTFTGGIGSTNTGGLTKLGSGTLTLSGSSGYTGATTLAGGVLALGNANAIPAAGNVTFTGGTLQYSTSNTADLAARIASSTSAIAIDTNNQSVTWAGNLANTNTGGLSKTGAGTLTLSGSNAFTGTVSVTGGTLAIGGLNAFPQTGVTGLSLNGGTLQGSGSVSPSSIPSVTTITLGASGGTLVNSLPASTQWYIYSPIAGGAGTGPLTLSGTSGELILGSSFSSYSGGTILSHPQVAITNDSSLGSGTITFTGGGLRATSAGARSLSNPVTISAGASLYGSSRDLTLSGPITLSGSTQTVTVTGTSLNSFTGSVGDGGAGLGLVKSGAGILALGGANTYTGTTTLAAGTLRLDNSSALGGGGNLSFTGGTLQYSGSNTADYSARIVGSSGAIAIDTNGQSVSFASALAASNSGGLTKSGSGTLTLAANNSYTGVTTVSGGTLQVGNGGVAGSITGNVTLSNTTAITFNRSDSLTYSGSITGTGSIMKLGAGTLSLSGSNNITGNTTIAGGTLSITGVNALPGSFTLDGGTLVNATGAQNFGKGMFPFTVGPGGGAVRSDLRIDPGSVISGTSPTALLTYGPTTTGSTGILLVISGNNTYAASTKVEAGMDVVVDNNNAFGTGALELAGARIRSRGGYPPRSLANAVTFSANTEFFGAVSDPNLTFTGSATLTGGTRTFQVNNVITSGTSAGQPGVVFTNVIGDGGNGFGITKTGAGVLALGGANTYSGATTLSAGTIQLHNQNALQNSTLSLSGTGGIVFDSVVAGNAFTLGGLDSSNNSATLALQNSAATAIALTVGGNNASTTYAGSLTGPGSLEKAGAGTLILSGSNTFTGTTTVTAGTLQIGWGGTTGSLAGNVINNAALVFSRSDAASYAGIISGSGSLTKSGAGTLTLSGSNGYSGATTLAGGVLALASANALPSSGTVTFTGGALQYSGSYTTDLSSRIAGSSGAVSIDTNNQNIAFATGLAASNVGGLAKLGSGTLTLSAANAFTGPVTVGGGVLAVGNAAALPASGNVSFTGGTLQYSASYTADLSSRIVGSTAAIAIDTNSQNVTWASSLANTNGGGLTKNGTGILTLSASNAYAGATTVNAGTLLVNNASALGSGTSVSVPNNATSLTIGGGITIGAGKTLTVAGNGANSDGGLNVTSGTGTWAGNVILSGRLGYSYGNLVITGSVGGSSFTVSGYGGDTNTNVSGYAVTLAGPTGYSGATGILRGWLKIGADNTLPVGTTLDVFTAPNNGAAAQAATFDLNGFNQTVAGLTSSGNNGKTGYANGYVTNTGASVKTLTVNQSTSGTFGGLITGNLAFTKSGAGNLTLMPIFVTSVGNAFVNGTNTFTGDTLVSAGTLTLSSATTSTSLALAGSTFDASGAGTLSFGSMTAATFGGLKGSGNLALQNDSSQAVALTVGASNGSTTYSGNLSGLGSLVKNGAGTLTLSGSNGYTGSTQLAAGVLALGGANALAGTGTVSFTGGTLQYGSGISTDLSAKIRGSSSAISIDTNGQDVAFAGAINNTNTAGLVKNGAGTLTLSGSNAYGGNTTVNAGTLAFTTDSVWTGLSGTIALDNATLAYTGTNAVNQVLSLPIQLGGSGGTLRNPGAAFWFVGGQISGAGPLTIGSGSTLMVFQGANTNSGGVTLQAGSQVVVANDSTGPAGAPTSGVFGTGTLALAGGSLRSTTGAARTVGNAVNVTADTTFFSAGSNIDKSITFTGPVTLSGGSRTFTVDTTGTGSPAINFTGAIGDGGNGYGLTKAGAGTLVLGGASTYTGQTAVSSGALVVNGSILSSVALSGSTSLSGRGSVGAISGAGLVGPGNSPGILAATSVDPSGGLAFAFEFTQANPDYTNAAASGNDLLSISGLTPFTSSLTSANVVSVYFTPSSVELGTLTGGFFTSSLQSDFLNSIASATYQYFVQDAGGSYLYNGQAYKTLAQYDAAKSVTVSTVAANGGQVMQMVVVPEPAALALAAIGIAVAGWSAATRRRQAIP